MIAAPLCLNSRVIAMRPQRERLTNRVNGVWRENGNVLSAIRGSSAFASITTPTWFVQEPVATDTC